MPMFAAVFVQIYAKILTLCILFLFAQCGQREGDPKISNSARAAGGLNVCIFCLFSYLVRSTKYSNSRGIGAGRQCQWHNNQNSISTGSRTKRVHIIYGMTRARQYFTFRNDFSAISPLINCHFKSC